MKKIILIIFSFLSINAFSQWNVQYYNQTLDLEEICSPTPEMAVAVGYHGNIVRTIDGGNNWTTSNIGIDVNLNSVRFIDNNVGFIKGRTNAGVVYLFKTIDGGENWIDITPNFSAVADLFCVNNQVIYACFFDGTTRTSSDLGSNWTIVNSGQPFSKLQFVNENIGFAAQQGYVYKTIDSGHTWTQLFEIDTLASTFPFYFFDENIGYFKYTNKLFKTIDSGQNSFEIDTFQFDINELFASTENIIWGITVKIPVGNPWENYTYRGKFSSGGNYSMEYSTPYFKSLQFSNPNIGYAIGFDYKIYKNSDGMMGYKTINNFSNIEIYPNPASENIYIKSNNKKTCLGSIMDQLGRIVFKEFLNTTNVVEIKTKSFRKGCYFVLIENEGKNFSKKIIIN